MQHLDYVITDEEDLLPVRSGGEEEYLDVATDEDEGGWSTRTASCLSLEDGVAVRWRAI